jgi:hypothetical protein
MDKKKTPEGVKALALLLRKPLKLIIPIPCASRSRCLRESLDSLLQRCKLIQPSTAFSTCQNRTCRVRVIHEHAVDVGVGRCHHAWILNANIRLRLRLSLRAFTLLKTGRTSRIPSPTIVPSLTLARTHMTLAPATRLVIQVTHISLQPCDSPRRRVPNLNDVYIISKIIYDANLFFII